MNFIKINKHFEITEGATYELVDDQLCRITSPGTLRALTGGSIAQAWVPRSIAEARVKGAISEACAHLSVAIPYSK